MPSKLSTTISKIPTIPNTTNSSLISEFHEYMKANSASERHQNNSLKTVIAFAFFIGKDVNFYDIKSKQQICSFLDTKIKNQEEDPDKRWITTWNYYLVHLKRFFRWLHNCHVSSSGDNTEDKREKIQALSLAKECYSMKLDLLTNANVVDDAIRFVSTKTKEKLKSASEGDKDESNEAEYGEQSRETNSTTLTTNV
jgi:hypothetical protein